jgi:predicted metalloprotease
MITADTLKTLTSFTAPALTRAINDTGYKGDVFLSAEFLGITNGGQFCYKVSYEEHGELVKGKVFLTYNPAVGKVIADY